MIIIKIPETLNKIAKKMLEAAKNIFDKNKYDLEVFFKLRHSS